MTLTFKGTEAEVRQALADLPRILAGLIPDVNGIGRSLQMRAGVTLLSKVQQAFIVKSRGGTGDDGIRWKPLSKAAIAARRVTAGEKKAAGISGKRVRGLLTPAQDKRWRILFATRKAWLMAKGMSPGAAAAQAASIAWATLKKEGAQTRLSVYGSRQVDILRDTGRLFRSLTPGVEDRPSGEPEQVFDVPPGRVIVGTKVPYASRQHKHRPLWPDQIPPYWWDAIKASLARGIARVLGQFLAGRSR